MKVSVSQIYIKPGVSFPFSHVMQRLLSSELSNCVEASAEFKTQYGTGYHLVVNMSADTDIVDNVVRGPTVFKRSRSVEYTVFLPYDMILQSRDGCREAMVFLLSGIRSILQQLRIDTQDFDQKKDIIIKSICTDTAMLKEPWPST